VDTVQVAWTATDVTAESNFELIYDSSNGTATLYQNGVTLGTKVGLPVGTIPSMMWTVGALLDQTGSPANWGAFTLSSLMVAGGTNPLSYNVDLPRLPANDNSEEALAA
jgi:hypothetical protein